MSEFGGWVDMAIKFWLAIFVFFILLAGVFVGTYRLFGWIGPALIIALWALAGVVGGFLDRRKP